ncbi:MAG: DinB family protein [Ktedonobacterales bacterium]
MTTRADELAGQFEAVNADVLAFVSACDDAAWARPCEGEGWTIGAVAAHIADGHQAVVHWMRAILAGQPVTMTIDQLNESNATRATTNTGRSRDDVLAALRERGDKAAAFVRSLGDDDLERSAPFGLRDGETVTAEWLISYILTGHPRRHLRSLRASASTGTA